MSVGSPSWSSCDVRDGAAKFSRALVELGLRIRAAASFLSTQPSPTNSNSSPTLVRKKICAAGTPMHLENADAVANCVCTNYHGGRRFAAECIFEYYHWPKFSESEYLIPQIINLYPRLNSQFFSAEFRIPQEF